MPTLRLQSTSSLPEFYRAAVPAPTFAWRAYRSCASILQDLSRSQSDPSDRTLLHGNAARLYVFAGRGPLSSPPPYGVVVVKAHAHAEESTRTLQRRVQRIF
ncbi:unnamed protein product [Rangifer tarandus platyrhynchus]|uniref:Uncharacterized protein n=1 Tax=Rangifer tarandus platyrhynchus TaxID=3082113 RepID=A0ABN8XIR2_RANTA|nr:unnamed protein product [Rangifer tarandus platyrhynchus]